MHIPVIRWYTRSRTPFAQTSIAVDPFILNYRQFTGVTPQSFIRAAHWRIQGGGAIRPYPLIMVLGGLAPFRLQKEMLKVGGS